MRGRKIRFRNRRAVLDAGIMILGAIIAIIAIIAATLAWSDILELSFTKLVIDLPQFDYDIQAGQESGNRNFEIYQILRNTAFIILILVMVFAGLSFVFEHVNWVPPETGYRILSKSVLFIFFFFFFPPLWDLLSVTVEQTSFWILNPSGQKQTESIEFLLTKLGSIESPEFTLDAVVAGITDPFGTLKNMFLTTFLAAFKAVAFLTFMFLAFLFGTIRIVLTAIVIVAIPVILMLSLVPFFRRVTRRLVDTFLGLMLAPIFSALVITAGVSHLQTLVATSPDPVVEWFAALAVMALAIFIPTIIAPVLGSVMGSVSSVATGAISTGTILTNMTGMGLARTVGSAITQVRQSHVMDMSTNPLSLAKLAFSRTEPFGEQKLSGMGKIDSQKGPMHGPFGRLSRL